MNAASFGANASVRPFVLAVLGGISLFVGGAARRGVYGNLVQYYLQNNVVVSALCSARRAAVLICSSRREA